MREKGNNTRDILERHKHVHTPTANAHRHCTHVPDQTLTYRLIAHKSPAADHEQHEQQRSARHISQDTRRWVTRNIIKGRVCVKEPANAPQPLLRTHTNTSALHQHMHREALSHGTVVFVTTLTYHLAVPTPPAADHEHHAANTYHKAHGGG